MGSDDFTFSVTQNLPTDLATGRTWQVGSYITRMGVYAPAAATNFAWSLIGDGEEVVPANTQPTGTAPSASPALEHRAINHTAFRQWKLVCLHAGAAAQNIRVQVEYETEAEAEAAS